MNFKDIENIIPDNLNPNDGKILSYLKEMIKMLSNKSTSIKYCNKILRRKYHIIPSKKDIRLTYQKYLSQIKIPYKLEKWMIKKSVRSRSGVLVVTLVMAPSWKKSKNRKSGVFSCNKDCYYCPQETDLNGIPTQPRSYLSNEPAMMRALQYNFDVKGQFCDRINSYINTGNIDITNKSPKKLEVIISGGTWDCFPKDYRDSYINELYWSANTYDNNRNMYSLEEEIKINETSNYRIIGLTFETRPDCINKYSILRYLQYGATRIQLGVQHYDDNILRKINRQCYLKDTIKAIYLLKQVGFKIVIHLMPDLPGSSPELDKWMFKQAIENSALQFDDLKIYPTAVCKSDNPQLLVKSKIFDWYNKKLYTPYAENNIQELIDVIKYYLINVKPWVRIQRIVRDIPCSGIKAGYGKKPNLRQIISQQMKKENKKTYEIRSMEVRDRKYLNYKPRFVVRKYIASGGIEYHLSLEAYDDNNIKYYMFIIYSWIFWFFTGIHLYWSGSKNYKALFGFLRLRLDILPGGGYIEELNNAGLIREVHIYGASVGIGKKGKIQHKGYGQYLIRKAEFLTEQHGYEKIAVISGVGVREYYKNKCNYNLNKYYMIKKLNPINNTIKYILLLVINYILLFLIL